MNERHDSARSSNVPAEEAQEPSVVTPRTGFAHDRDVAKGTALSPPASSRPEERRPASGNGGHGRASTRSSAPYLESPSPMRQAWGDILGPLAAWPWKKSLLICMWLVLFGVACAVLGVAMLVNHYSRSLPDVSTLEQGYAPPQLTRVLARDGTLLADIFSERRTVVPFERIPDHVKSAFLAAEDAAFYQHEGLDYLGLVRALIVNVRAGEVRQGGSTITQQVVKNVLLDRERSYKRKIRETILAYRIEKTLTKEQILGMYMNHLYLGHGRYGVEEAARFYFGKHVEQLDVGEGALIAGIVAAPERFSPRKSEALARSRRSYVLGQMLKKGFMTQEVYEAYVDSPIRLTPHPETESDLAPEIVSHTKRMLQEVVPERAARGGFTVKTTIDPALQVLARKAVQDGLDNYLKRQKLAPPFTLAKRKLWGQAFEGTPRQHGIYVGTVLARDDENKTIDVQVGDVVGRVELSREERFNPDHKKPTDFVGDGAALRVRVLDNPAGAGAGGEPGPATLRLALELGPQAALVALDAGSGEVLASVGSYEALPGALDRSVQAKRQPGSTFKPIFYSYALSTGEVTAATHFSFPAKAERGDDAQASPAFDVMSLRQGVAKSDNRVARAVFRAVGPRQVVSWAHALGIRSSLGADDSLALGAYEVAPVEMAGAFLPFANGGKVAPPKFFLEVTSGEGPLEFPDEPPARQVMEPQAAYLMTSILQSVVEEGTARRAQSLHRPLAGKTGTTNRSKDAWFVGYSVDYVVAVWVGYDDALPLGWGESGATTALPIWMDFMKAAHEGRPAVEFPRPGGIVSAEIDPATGTLARYGQEDAMTELFLAGTVPSARSADDDESGFPADKDAEDPARAQADELAPDGSDEPFPDAEPGDEGGATAGELAPEEADPALPPGDDTPFEAPPPF